MARQLRSIIDLTDNEVVWLFDYDNQAEYCKVKKVPNSTVGLTVTFPKTGTIIQFSLYVSAEKPKSVILTASKDDIPMRHDVARLLRKLKKLNVI